MPRRKRIGHSPIETPEPLKPVVTAAIQFVVGGLLLVALVLIVAYATDPQVLWFDFLFR